MRLEIGGLNLYTFKYDEITGGILLTSSPSGFSTEPRPVYAEELDILGFNQYWSYQKQNDIPYMWAEANSYWYRGKRVAKIKGGNLFVKPDIVLSTDENGKPISPETIVNELLPIDIEGMVKKNHEMLEIIEQTTVKKIIATYEKYKNKIDLFHVAFSGGKDSAVLLELVKRALPKGSFVTIFGDTGMEFPDTYDAVEETRRNCEKENIPFFVAKSHLLPKDSWKIFGPPARVLRWCCHVHKSTPQLLKLREIAGKSDFKGLDFVGVRAAESVKRSQYQYENFGKKQKGQFSHNPILEWTSAEIWLYIFANNIYVNNTYKKGNPRAGCLLCPMSGGWSDYIRRQCYKSQIDDYIDLISYSHNPDDQLNKETESYIINGGWNARRNGRDLATNPQKCIERSINGFMNIEIINPTSDWTQWIKTIGCLNHNCDGSFTLEYGNDVFDFFVNKKKNGYIVSISESIINNKPSFSKLFRQVFRKASYCQACRVCETNCSKGCISFYEGKVNIDKCIKCLECHNIDSGCLLFHSLRHPQGGGNSMKSLNSFADHAPKPEWLRSYFELKNDFFIEHTLGPMMYDMFRRFLRDALLNEKNSFTPFAEIISRIGWETNTAQGLILINLVTENPQFDWFVNNLEIGKFYDQQIVEGMLTSLDIKPKDAKSIIKSFKRFTETPLGTNLNFGQYTENKELVRLKCSVSDSRVILYGLFKFAEKCNNYKEFTLSKLYQDLDYCDAISPVKIFGIDYNDMIPLLIGLTTKYPDYITATFTHDLEKISLAEDKSSIDVLGLFGGIDRD